MSMRGTASRFLRQGMALSARPSYPTSSSPCRAASRLADSTSLNSNTSIANSSSSYSNTLSQYQSQQRAEMSTLRRGLTGPQSARIRLPMRGLEEFQDPEIVKIGDIPVVGRHWTVPELRKKSFEDLHKLWFVLYKEKNMLASELARSRRSKAPLPAGDRRQKVKWSMKAIRVVVGERQRIKREAIAERQLAAKREKRAAAREAKLERSEADTAQAVTTANDA